MVKTTTEQIGSQIANAVERLVKPIGVFRRGITPGDPLGLTAQPIRAIQANPYCARGCLPATEECDKARETMGLQDVVFPHANLQPDNNKIINQIKAICICGGCPYAIMGFCS